VRGIISNGAAVRRRQRPSADHRAAAVATVVRGVARGWSAQRSASTPTPARGPEGVPHRYYDAVVVGGEWTRAPYAAALRTPIERVIALGSPRTDFFFDEAALEAARARVLSAHRGLAGRRVVVYAPTFRGRGVGKRAAPGLDARRLRAALPADHALVPDPEPRPDGHGDRGYDVVVDPTADINDLLALTDILITDYSSSVVEFALLHRPIILLVGDLPEYEVDPGLYLDYRTEMIGTQVTDTDGVIDAIATDRFDLSGYDAFIERQLGASQGGASARFVTYFLGDPQDAARGGGTLPPDVRHI
jgi:CDP-ribitol ribitolphosphotransferase